MQGLAHGKTVHSDISHLDAQVVGDIHSVETQGPACFQAGGLRPQLRSFGRGQEGDRGVLADRDLVAKAVGGHSEGKICQSKYSAAHGCAVGIHMLRPQGQYTNSVVWLHLQDPGANHGSGKTVVVKAFIEFIQ